MYTGGHSEAGLARPLSRRPRGTRSTGDVSFEARVRWLQRVGTARPACTDQRERGLWHLISQRGAGRRGVGLATFEGLPSNRLPLGQRVTVAGGPRGSSPSRQRQKWRVYTGGHSEDSIGYLFLAPNVRNSTHRRRNRKSIDDEIGKAWLSES